MGKTKRKNDLARRKAWHKGRKEIEKMGKILDAIQADQKEKLILFEEIFKMYPCKQFQLMRMDLQSMIDNLDDLKNNGPKPAQEEIPLSESEMPVSESDMPSSMRGEEVESVSPEN